MARDSLFGERIVWQADCRGESVPTEQKATAAAAAVVSVVTTFYAVVASQSLDAPVGGMILLAAWCATLALGAWRIPIWWRSSVHYVVTEKHVIWQRGPIRRSIEIGQISYALIRWSRQDRSVGDLVLVRAVPTGALRRTLSLTLHDVESPDRLWAAIRGVEPPAPLGTADRPLAQRLDPGERVLWSAAPTGSSWTHRRAGTLAIGALLVMVFVRSVARSWPSVAGVLRLHALSPALATLFVSAIAMGMLLLLAVAVAATYFALVRPPRLARRTRYFVTNARVLIRRGDEELSLDRSRIAYVIDAPSRRRHDVFLVLDGPHARALAPSGAFDGAAQDDLLRPVFTGITDTDTVGRILATPELTKKAA